MLVDFNLPDVPEPRAAVSSYWCRYLFVGSPSQNRQINAIASTYMRLVEAAVVEYGAYRVAADLHLDYAVLKRRTERVGSTAPCTELAPRFVELFAPAGPTRAAVASPPECVVEVANARGAKMRVELNGSGLAALAGLCSALWSAA